MLLLSTNNGTQKAKDIEICNFERHHFQYKISIACQVESQSMKRVTNGQETLAAFFECFPHTLCMTCFSD